MTAPAPLFQVSQNNLELPFAVMYFTLTGTTTPANVFSNADLAGGHAYPVDPSNGCYVTADANGLFPAIYLDPTQIYRMRLIAEAGDLTHPIVDRDPVNDAEFGLTAAEINAALGFTVQDPAATVLTGEGRLSYGSPLGALHQDGMGFRLWPVNTLDENYTFVLDDAQKMALHDSAGTDTWIVPPHSAVAFPQGAYIPFMNVNTGTLLLQRGDSVSIVLAGVGTSQDVTIAEWGFGFLVNYGVDQWMAYGTGLT